MKNIINNSPKRNRVSLQENKEGRIYPGENVENLHKRHNVEEKNNSIRKIRKIRSLVNNLDQNNPKNLERRLFEEDQVEQEDSKENQMAQMLFELQSRMDLWESGEKKQFEEKSIYAPSGFLKETKNNYAFGETVESPEFRRVMDIQASMQNLYSSYKSFLNEAAFDNFIAWKTMEKFVFTSYNRNDMCSIVMMQFCGIRADSIRVGYKSKDYSQGRDFFNNAFGNAKGSISEDSYKKLLDKALEKEPKKDKKDKKCKFCFKTFFKGHQCQRRRISLNSYNSSFAGDIVNTARLNGRRQNQVVQNAPILQNNVN